MNQFKVQLKANVSETFPVVSVGVDVRNDRTQPHRVVYTSIGGSEMTCLKKTKQNKTVLKLINIVL